MLHSALRTDSRRTRGFTLVELLVVIGIIAVLISVLLPVLGSARRAAASVKCLSNLKNLHNAFLMYAGDFKNAMPCARQDDELNGVPINQNNTYWSDKIYPYLLKKAVPINAFTAADADAYHKSVLWCPVWHADHPEINVEKNYTDRFKTGYGYNIWFGYRPNFPSPDAQLPSSRVAMRAAGFFGSQGRYYKRNEITDQANRLLVADTNLWMIGMKITNAQGDLAGQYVYTSVAAEDGNSPAGAMNLDRYRHGKYSPVNGTRHDIKGGQVAFNVLFVDGHAATLNSIQDGYRAIRMKYP
jgi:prepilin-type N-terminal cleavage/methylation domain-containing protein/prepilin-type processing-associated H-X9-DG protein